MRSLRSVLSVTMVLVVSTALLVYHLARPDQADAATRGAALTGTYPNWFDHIGKDQGQVDAKLKEIYNAVFTENGPADQRIYQPVGSDMANILSTYEDDTRTEGNSWGMMVALQMNDRERFNKIWKFAKTYMQCPNAHTDCDGLYDGLFIWHVDDDAPYGHFKLTDGTDEFTPAPDGDIYFATALLMAGQRWGDNDGILDYTAEAGRILTAMKDTSSLKAGELSIFNPENKLARFIPTWVEGSGSLVDTSYQLPGFYEYWARYDPTVANRSFWNEAAGAARSYWAKVIAAAGNQGNGIFPDCTKQDGGPLSDVSCASGYKYGSDGWRTIQNVVMDQYWWNGEAPDGHAPLAAQVDWADQFLGFMRDKRTTMAGEYKVDGTAVSDWSGGSGQRLMTATGAMVTTDGAVRDDFLNLAWDTPITTGEWRYYHNSLHMLGMLHLAGRYRVWPESGVAGSPAATSPTPSTSAGQPASSAPPTTGPGTPPAASWTVYGDSFAPGWAGEVWNGTMNPASRTPAVGGKGRAIAVTPTAAWAAVALTSTAGSRPTAGLASIKLQIHGGRNGVKALQLMVNPKADGSGPWSARVKVDAPADTWTEVTVDLRDVGSPPAIGAIVVQDATGSRQGRFSIDEVRLS